jgi:predicted MPP superfamily phosphohydrolase
MVNRINEINAQAIFFTGDLVNTNSNEALPFISTLSQLDATHGVFSVFGNHDYSEYGRWESKEAQIANHKLLYDYETQAGWKLLNNEHVTLRQGNDSIIVIGVENIGEPPFKTYGDLKKAYPNLNDNNFKILLSHNPTHWRNEVTKSSNIDITLSGHTHAMQSIFSFFGKKYSLASKKYAEWGGLYSEKNQHLYVNIGIGCVGIPARFGAKPEITVITLRKK